MQLSARVLRIAAAVALTAAAAGCATGERDTADHSPAATSATALVPVNPATVPPSAADQAAATSTALQWAQRWLRPAEGVQSGQWIAGLQPLSTPEAVTQLRTVDPQNVDSTRITGPAAIHSAMPDDITVDVPTDAVTVRVVVVRAEGRWLVNGWNPAS
ncbi:hypothetical protein CU254_42345 (plasmid) [Amycolatopsis sp. AA4]|uniref:hypothetical protein n=1 Tax=Actinomycetes TaxID=1760 RepID=UPI0001B5768A|nr:MULTISPECIES: hypothetical protein [Actinomycetes]ATY17230.1 hypothetical protein CU254_42345 [Amycolatopsis sp. AA4]